MDLGELPPLVAVAASVIALHRSQRDLRIVLAPTRCLLQELFIPIVRALKMARGADPNLVWKRIGELHAERFRARLEGA